MEALLLLMMKYLILLNMILLFKEEQMTLMYILAVLELVVGFIIGGIFINYEIRYPRGEENFLSNGDGCGTKTNFKFIGLPSIELQ